MTLEEIGSRFDLTRERVRQIRNNSLEKLRKHSYGGLVKEHLN
jgi:RNA polymerase primary sigma factor